VVVEMAFEEVMRRTLVILGKMKNGKFD